MTKPSFSLLPLLFMVASGCGGHAKPATIQPRGQVEAPAFPVDPSKALQLNDVKATIVFNTNVLLWDPLPAGEQVRDILEATKDTRVLRSQALDFIKDKLIPAHQAIASVEAATNGAEVKIEAARLARDLPAVRNYLHSASDNYVESQLQALVDAKTISPEAQTHANLMWAAYCDAKLWEFAVSPQLSRSFTERPTPMGLCEGYYTKKKYFQDAELCGPAAAGKDYFACIWLAGVTVSDLLPSKTDPSELKCLGGQTKSRADTIASWVARDGSGPLRSLLRNMKRINSSSPTYSFELRSVVMNGSGLSRALTSSEPLLGKCRNAFSRFSPTIPAGRDRDDAGAPYWVKESPSQLLTIGEANPLAADLKYRLLPATGNVDTDKAFYAKFGQIVRPFGQRELVVAPGETVASIVQPTYSDDQINVVSAPPTLATSKANRDAVESSPLLPNLASFDTPAIKELKEKTSVSALTRSHKLFDDLRQSFSHDLVPTLDKNFNLSLAVGAAPGASVYLNTFDLTASRKDADLNVKLALGFTAEVQFGCVHLDTNAPCTVSQAELGVHGHQAAVSFDPASNLISVRFPLGDHPEIFGFPADRPHGTGPFNALPPASLHGKFVLIEAYGNQLGLLPVITGNMFILDTDGVTKLYSGSLTGDAYSQTKAALQASNGLSGF